MLSKTFLGVTLINWVFTLMFAVLALVCLAQSKFTTAAQLSAGIILIPVVAWLARRPSANDIYRVSSMEYADERDRHIATRGFAAVGVVSLFVPMVGFLVCIVFFPQAGTVIAVLTIIMGVNTVVWSVANYVYAKIT